MLGDQQVFEHGHAGKQADVLEGAGHARGARDLEALHAFEKKERAARRVAPLPAAEVSRGSASKAALAPMSQRDDGLRWAYRSR